MGYEGEISRGIRMTEEELFGIQVGDVIDQRGVSSWTADREVADEFAREARKSYGDGIAVVLVMGGTSHGADISPYSSRPYEAEVAVSSRSRQVVTRVDTSGISYDEAWGYWRGIAVVYLEESD